MRYELVNWHMSDGRSKEAKQILNRHAGDPTALWVYPEALWLFRQEGPSNRANRALMIALEANAFIPPVPVGKKKIPVRLPNY